MSQITRLPSFLLLNDIPLCIYAYYDVFIHLSVDGQFGYFHFLSIVDNVAMNMEIQISLQYAVFIFLDVYPEVKLLNYMVVLFLIWRNLHTVLQSEQANFHSQQ